jgi:hypothetical protein
VGLVQEIEQRCLELETRLKNPLVTGDLCIETLNILLELKKVLGEKND